LIQPWPAREAESRYLAALDAALDADRSRSP
jgi:hypothetical protein